MIKVDPVNFELHASAQLGQVSFGSLVLGPTMFSLDASKSSLNIGFSGHLSLGPGTVDIGPDMEITGSIGADVSLEVGTSGIAASASLSVNVQGELYTPALCENPQLTLFGCNGDWSYEAPVDIDVSLSFSLNSSGLSVSISGLGTFSLPFPSGGDSGVSAASTRLGAKGGGSNQTTGPATADIGKQPAPPAPAPMGSWQQTGSLAAATELASQVTLPGGRVLIAGGSNGATPSANTEIYDPTTAQWTEVAAMHTARAHPQLVALSDGNVLAAGGVGATGPLNTAEIYNPATNIWTRTAAMSTPRAYAISALLPGDQVLVAGGLAGQVTATSGSARYLSSAEIYDAASGRWHSVASMPGGGRALAAAATLKDDSVLVVGGYGLDKATRSALEYVPSTRTWRSAGTTQVPHFLTNAITLTDGRVLVVGGSPQSEVFNPATRTWALAGVVASAPQWASAVALPDGRALVVGGIDRSKTASAAYLWNPTTRTWTPAKSLPGLRFASAVATLPSGAILVAGGGSTLTDAHLESYLFSTTTSSPTTVHQAAIAVPSTHHSSHALLIALAVALAFLLLLSALSAAFIRRRKTSTPSPETV
jgi:N-acetylneuraminic acid mutarotase